MRILDQLCDWANQFWYRPPQFEPEKYGDYFSQFGSGKLLVYLCWKFQFFPFPIASSVNRPYKMFNLMNIRNHEPVERFWIKDGIEK